MNITLYRNNSDRNYVNKSLSNPSIVSGTLRESTNVISPILTIDTTEFADNILNYNYCYIEEFGRYYFITSCEVVLNNVWRLALYVDVLMSFRPQILNLSAIIARQENTYNLYLPDERFLVNSNRIVTAIEFPGRVPSSGDINTRQIVITLAGGPVN